LHHTESAKVNILEELKNAMKSYENLQQPETRSPPGLQSREQPQAVETANFSLNSYLNSALQQQRLNNNILPDNLDDEIRQAEQNLQSYTDY